MKGRRYKVLYVASGIAFAWFAVMFVLMFPLFAFVPGHDAAVSTPGYSGCYATDALVAYIECRGYARSAFDSFVLNTPVFTTTIMPIMAIVGVPATFHSFLEGAPDAFLTLGLTVLSILCIGLAILFPFAFIAKLVRKRFWQQGSA